MLVTDVNQGWGKKVNFTDKNDVFVGFDMSPCCCENFGWYVAKEITKDIECEQVQSFEDYVFDTAFFESIEDGNYDVDAYAVFKLVKDGAPDLFLHLYNHHNGYYSHGFEAKINGVIWQEGGL